ncbi:MAG: ABC transporter substrate-binding protein [Deltaproteobacteria bacterium]|nr:ABC transporter substrate-binding protein [Deltaproteobacteria bacterium]
MKLIRNLTKVSAVLIVLTMPASARAGEATAQLKRTIDEFVAILVNTSVEELQATGLPQKALKLIYGRFDFSEMTKRSLGKHWNLLAQPEQTEFVEAYTNRLLYAYGRTVRASGDEKIEFKGETGDDKFANVETKVVSGNGEELPIDYHLLVSDGQWRVYDMVIDQISIVKNYRAQFERVIAKTSIKELLQRMKKIES